MKNHLNMIENRSAVAFTGNIGVINNAAVNNMKLQDLLATKDEAEIAEFEMANGWSWLDACTTALEANPDLTVETFEQRFERVTGWTYGDAVDMASESRRDDRFFGRRHNRNRRTESSNLSHADKFERATGWTLGDAIDMAAESRRDDRLFGGRHSTYLN